MKQTRMPFYETAEDATKSAILRSRLEFKQVACRVRPELTNPDSAYAWLKNALRDDAREKLSGDQHLLIANLTGEFDFLYYCAQQCHHSMPSPVEPEDEKQQVYEQILANQNALLDLFQRLERLGQDPTAKPVRSVGTG